MLGLNGGSCLSSSRHGCQSTKAAHVQVVVIANGRLNAAHLQIARQTNPIGLVDRVQIDRTLDEAG